MALVTCNFFSYTLGMDYECLVLLPEKRQEPHIKRPHKKYPVLYLLHGHSDDHTSWLRKSLIELVVREHELIVVMPNAHRGFYTNSKKGHDYFTFFSEELPTVINNYFPASDKREDNYVAGLSMGGYGALKLALNCPDKFVAAGSLSGALAPFESLQRATESDMFSVQDFRTNFINVFGSKEDFLESDNDLFYLTQQLDKVDKPKPKIYQSCGTDDPLYDTNLAYKELITQSTSNFHDYYYIEEEGGHDWKFWNQQLPIMLKTLGIIKE